MAADVFVVKAAAFQHNYTAGGNLLPNESVEIKPEIAGRVTSIGFAEGGNVRKGQVMITLNAAELNAQIQKLQAQRKLQTTTGNRQKELLDIGGISRQEYDANQTGIAGIDADIAATQAELQRMRILAPFSGKAGIRNISAGAVVNSSTIITTLQQLHPLKMDFEIPAEYQDKVGKGSVVKFTIDGRLDTITAKVSAMDPAADPQTRTIKVRALVENPDGRLTPGTFTQVTIPLESNAASILVPSQAIIPTTRDRQVAVLRQGKVFLTNVVTGIRTHDEVEILKGLSSGDTILTTGMMQVKDSMAVKPHNVVIGG